MVLFHRQFSIQCNVVGLHIYCLRLCVYYSGIYGHQESAYDGFKS